MTGLAVGAAAMAASDVSSTMTGAADPRTWGVEGWLADVVPHVAYGMATAATFDRLRSG